MNSLNENERATMNSLCRISFFCFSLLAVLAGLSQLHAQERFARGDANADGHVDISDPVTLLFHLFRGASVLDCEDHGDADDNGRLELTDAVFLLDFLFRRGVQPRPPYPAPGLDTSADPFECGDSS